MARFSPPGKTMIEFMVGRIGDQSEEDDVISSPFLPFRLEYDVKTQILKFQHLRMYVFRTISS